MVETKVENCPILPNYSVRKDGNCVRFTECQVQGRTKDPRCKARRAA